MILYEVNTCVEKGIAAAYAEWLGPHIEQILKIEGFVSAAWFEVEHDDPDHVHWTIQYYLVRRSDLDAYFRDHAAALRADGVQRFGERFTAERRILRQKRLFETDLPAAERLSDDLFPHDTTGL